MSDSLQKIPGFLSSLKRVLSWWSDEVKRTEGDFLGGAAPSIADFKIFHTLNNISTLFGEAYFNKAVTQSLRAWYASMAALPPVASYLRERPQAGSGQVGMPDSFIRHANPSELPAMKAALSAADV